MTRQPSSRQRQAATPSAESEEVSPGIGRRLLLISNPTYKMLVWFVFLICIGSIVVMVWAAADTSDPMPKGKERLMDIGERLALMTAAALIGLLGGRAASPDTGGQNRQGV